MGRDADRLVVAIMEVTESLVSSPPPSSLSPPPPAPFPGSPSSSFPPPTALAPHRRALNCLRRKMAEGGPGGQSTGGDPTGTGGAKGHGKGKQHVLDTASDRKVPELHHGSTSDHVDGTAPAGWGKPC